MYFGLISSTPMAADALAPHIARTTAAMLLTVLGGAEKSIGPIALDHNISWM